MPWILASLRACVVRCRHMPGCSAAARIKCGAQTPSGLWRFMPGYILQLSPGVWHQQWNVMPGRLGVTLPESLRP